MIYQRVLVIPPLQPPGEYRQIRWREVAPDDCGTLILLGLDVVRLVPSPDHYTIAAAWSSRPELSAVPSTDSELSSYVAIASTDAGGGDPLSRSLWIPWDRSATLRLYSLAAAPGAAVVQAATVLTLESTTTRYP